MALETRAPASVLSAEFGDGLVRGGFHCSRATTDTILFQPQRLVEALLLFLLLFDWHFVWVIGEHRLWDLCSNHVPINRRSERMFRL